MPDIPLHELRHTSATLLISQNVDVKTVSNRLGHAQTSTTMDIYSQALQKMDEQAAVALDDLLTKNA
ncbi:MAG: tyrosine-type recombinase/integrase [Lachnospiraceae bacterium]|nr:tyrosine-type recombinase/integrase [Lachnospiraceae bacterium]